MLALSGCASFDPRQPGAHILFVVVVEMVKNITRLDAPIVHAHKIIPVFSLTHNIDTNILREFFHRCEEPLKHVTRFLQDRTRRAFVVGFIKIRIDLVIVL